MRRSALIAIVLLMMTAAALPVLAQDDAEPTAPPSPGAVEQAQEAAERAAEAADRAEQALEDISETEARANEAVGLAGDMFGFFEAMSAVIGIVVPILIVIAGFLGWRRLESAQRELREAREEFEAEMKSRNDQLEKELKERNSKLEKDLEERSQELDKLGRELESVVNEQRNRATDASVALALLPVGERQYRAQDYSGAIDTYQRALELDRNNPIIHYRLGYVYTQSGELEKAQQYLENAIELDKKFVPAQAALGYVHRRMGDRMQKEIDRLVQAGADPDSSEITQREIERDKTYVRSEDLFVDALGKLPKLMDEDGESWWGALGGLYRRRGQVRQAINAYKRGTQVTPQSSYPFSNLALLYAQVGQFDDMQRTYRRVEQLAWNEVQADVDNYWAYADLIVARLAQGKVDETYEVLDTALATAPEDSPYTLESLKDTLNRLSTLLPQEQTTAIQGVVTYIDDFVARRDARAEESEKVVKSLTGEYHPVNPDDQPGGAGEDTNGSEGD